ncbi:hypothetical protein EZV62_000453 [Acer yangbiense]|uniref:Uncharacterized protein n=1 Tax=Acer yangbiense TaxID=1000413 RepID=A0A5C7ISQ3_9ROSI|nr:hypothetical protein EZV62_000453 [Acer yangbiense]
MWSIAIGLIRLLAESGDKAIKRKLKERGVIRFTCSDFRVFSFAKFSEKSVVGAVPTAEEEDQIPPAAEPSVLEGSAGEEGSEAAGSCSEDSAGEEETSSESAGSGCKEVTLTEFGLGENLDDFKKMTIELANAGVDEKLSDDNEAIILLNSLPDSFKDVKAAIKYGRTSLSLDECISAFKSKDLELKMEKNDSGDKAIKRKLKERGVIRFTCSDFRVFSFAKFSEKSVVGAVPTAEEEDQIPPAAEPSVLEGSAGEEGSEAAGSCSEDSAGEEETSSESAGSGCKEVTLTEFGLGENLDDFKKMTIELANAGVDEKLSDDNEAIILLNSLPDSFKDVKATIKYGRTSLSLDECISAFKFFELMWSIAIGLIRLLAESGDKAIKRKLKERGVIRFTCSDFRVFSFAKFSEKVLNVFE